jgi:hypothetical protein
MFKGFTVRRLYKSFGVKGVIRLFVMHLQPHNIYNIYIIYIYMRVCVSNCTNIAGNICVSVRFGGTELTSGKEG